jgi:Fe-S-cluster-containing dehydrogenase component
MKAFIIDVSICNGCYCCQIACKDEHVNNDWMPYARPQPDTGHFWLKLNEFTRGTAPRVKMHYVPELCRHCDRAPCMTACPVPDAIYKRNDGLVIIDPAKCTGCKQCTGACPYGAIYFNEELSIAQKCTGCAHLLDNGWQEPRCVEACPTQALRFVEEAELESVISKYDAGTPDKDTSPRVYYLNIPRKFVAGAVYDPVVEDVIAGATCSLTDTNTDDEHTTLTDDFGDFWFEDLEISNFTLKVEANGKSKTIADINTEKDVNLGDIPL